MIPCKNHGPEANPYCVDCVMGHSSSESLELILQKCDGVRWPCICRKPRAYEENLLCAECWVKIPVAKRRGFNLLERGTEEHRLAAEQILRLAAKNLPE